MTPRAAAVHRSVSRRRRRGPGAAGRVRRSSARVWAPRAPLPASSPRARRPSRGTARAAALPAVAPYLPFGIASPLRDWLVLELVGVVLGGFASAWLGRAAAARDRARRRASAARQRMLRPPSAAGADGFRRQARARLHQRPGAQRRRAAVGRQLDLHRHLLRRRLRLRAAGPEAVAMTPLDRNRRARPVGRAAGRAAHRLRLRLVPGARRAGQRAEAGRPVLSDRPHGLQGDVQRAADGDAGRVLAGPARRAATATSSTCRRRSCCRRRSAASLFGVGFLVAGLCPGTSCVAAATGRRDGLGVIAGMLLGVGLFNAAFDVDRAALLRHAARRGAADRARGRRARRRRRRRDGGGAGGLRAWPAASNEAPVKRLHHRAGARGRGAGRGSRRRRSGIAARIAGRSSRARRRSSRRRTWPDAS